MTHKIIRILSLLLALPLWALAEAGEATAEAAAVSAEKAYTMQDMLLFALSAATLMVLVWTTSTLTRLNAAIGAQAGTKQSWWASLRQRLEGTVPIEREDDIKFDHEFDGIEELDNKLPPWWVGMFYMTIIFAVVYYTYYHFAGIGASSQEEYETEMAEAKAKVDQFRSTQANLVDETNVEALADATAIEAGKGLFSANCAACHGTLGEGLVGPNLTDPYWIHGGSIKDVFKTIKYGVPEKGMIAWQSQLSASDMQKVSSYILTLQGSNPPNPKEPQGELYAGEEAAPAPVAAEQDSTQLGLNE